jgi:hypothetical protein
LLRRLRERFDEPLRNVCRRRRDMRDDSDHFLAEIGPTSTGPRCFSKNSDPGQAP